MHTLQIVLPEHEVLNHETGEFIILGGHELVLEYSLYTISIWESKWKKPFATSMETFTPAEELDWFKCMCISSSKELTDNDWLMLTHELRRKIYEYITDSMTATTINKIGRKPGKKRILTTEIIYFWMAELNLPFSCEHWHFNRLMRLIEVGFLEQAPAKKMSRKEAAMLQRDLNASRRAANHTLG